MDVSIIIVNYNTSLLLKNCLESIIEQTSDLNYEIIVVDNASKDKSCDIVKRSFPKVKLIENDTNLGFGNANNTGALIAKGKYLFFLNSDTLLITNAVKILFSTMERDISNTIGVCCGNLYKEDLSPNYSYSLRLPSLWNIVRYRAHLSIKDEIFNCTEVIKDILNVIGADLFISSQLFNSIDGFDNRFFMYVEDSELSYRINKLKLRAVSVPSAKIIHLQGKSSLTRFKIRNEIDGYLYFFKKHFNIKTLMFYIIIELFFCFLRIVINLILLRANKVKVYIENFNYLLTKI